MDTAVEYVERIIFGESGLNTRDAARMYAARFPFQSYPDQKVVLKMITRTQENGHVMPDRRHLGGRQKLCMQ